VWTRRHTIGADNNGEITFDALQAGCDETDEVTGDGSAELLDDGSIYITFAYHNGVFRYLIGSM
jgi:hypothetical protein